MHSCQLSNSRLFRTAGRRSFGAKELRHSRSYRTNLFAQDCSKYLKAHVSHHEQDLLIYGGHWLPLVIVPVAALQVYARFPNEPTINISKYRWSLDECLGMCAHICARLDVRLADVEISARHETGELFFCASRENSTHRETSITSR